MVTPDLVRGQMVVCYGHTCIVREVDYNNNLVRLEFPNGEWRWEDFNQVVEENDLVDLEEDADFDDDYDW